MMDMTMTQTPSTVSAHVDEILIVKLGGGDGLDLERCLDDLAACAAERPLVVVHGVSGLLNRMCEQIGHPVRMMTSPGGHTSRYTDPATRDIYVQAAEQANRQIVEGLRARGVPAVGLTGSDTAISGERKRAVRAVVDGRVRIVRDDYSGTITSVDAARLQELLAEGYVPVLPPLAVGGEDGFLNVDGDRASAAVAGALGADDLVILSNVSGVYRNFPDENSFVPLVPAHQLDSALEWAQGRMKRKVLGAREALASGVERVIISDGRQHNPVQCALSGQGTVFSQ
jgi:[amino group carrier protein]-L-2-aminoadipate 6-kinase